MGEIFTKVGRTIRDNSVIISTLCFLFSSEAWTNNEENTKLENETRASVPQERHHN